MRLALLQVKEELGPDAVIMSNKKVAGGVEIVAAVDGEADDSNLPSSRIPSRHEQQNYTKESQFNRRLQDERYLQDSRHLQDERHLQDDRVSLRNTSRSGTTSTTKRFADMLRHYHHPQHANQNSDDTQHSEDNPDSLAALLKRQSREQADASPEGAISSSLAKDPGLAKLIAEDRRQERRAPKLNPARYSRNRHQTGENDETSQEINSMREEMRSIRRLLEHQVSGLMWQEVERQEPLRAMLIKRLEKMGLSSELAEQLVCYIPENTPAAKAWQTVLDLVADQISVTKNDILYQGGVVALLGPTGVGKTTTIAKLAARAAMEYGPEKVALVTTDTFRIGAREQLAIYGRIIGCPVKVAKDSNELAEVIYQLRNRRLVLVDTAGMGQRDVRLTEQLDTLMQDSGSVIESYLVLPATAQRRVLQEIIDHFKRIPLSGCILTKIDESLSLGEFISVVIQNSLPVAYVANGQRVPEDIVIAQPKYMAAKAGELLEKSAADEYHDQPGNNNGF